MVAAASMPVPAAETAREERVLLSKVPWSTGWLEIMSPSNEHETATSCGLG